MTKKIVGALSAMLVVLGGCAKDRTIDDWRREQVQQEEAAIAAVTGDYRGTLVSDADNSLIGLAKIHFKTNRRSSQSTSTPGAEQQAVLQGVITITGTSPMTLAFDNGSFDRAANQFNVQATVPGRGEIELKGTFADGKVVGSIEATNFPDQGGRFELIKDGPEASVQGLRTRVEQADKFLFNEYSATGNFREGPAAPVKMAILRQRNLEEQNFMDVFLPTRTVEATITINNDPFSSADFKNAVWDSRTKHLEGDYQADRMSVRLICDERTVNGGEGWYCQYISLINHQGLIFTATFAPVSNALGSLQ
jgi:hypothetical protein